MIVCLRQIQEKCIEQNQPLYIVFIDFTKAFDSVSRSELWCVLRKYGCTNKFLNLIKSIHTGMRATVSLHNSNSDEFEVSNGVKQGCVLAPTLFSIYLAAMLEVAFQDSTTGIYIQTRKDANLFSVAQFRAKTKTTLQIVRDLLFADDSALVAHGYVEIQTLVSKFAKVAEQFSLNSDSVDHSQKLDAYMCELALFRCSFERNFGFWASCVDFHVTAIDQSTQTAFCEPRRKIMPNLKLCE